MTMTEEEKRNALYVIRHGGSCSGECSKCLANKAALPFTCMDLWGDTLPMPEAEYRKTKVAWFKSQLSWEQEDI